MLLEPLVLNRCCCCHQESHKRKAVLPTTSFRGLSQLISLLCFLWCFSFTRCPSWLNPCIELALLADYRDGLSEAAFWCDLTVDTTEVDGWHSPNPILGLWKCFLKNILPQNLWQDLNRWSASVTTIQCISASRRFLTDGQFSVCSSWISCWEAFSVSLTVESPTLLLNNMPIPIICLYKLQNV